MKKAIWTTVIASWVIGAAVTYIILTDEARCDEYVIYEYEGQMQECAPPPPPPPIYEVEEPEYDRRRYDEDW